MSNSTGATMFSVHNNPPYENQDQYTKTLSVLLSALTELLTRIEADAGKRLQPFEQYYPDSAFTPSAMNLAHYLAFRQTDLRELQGKLAEVGLSSLGRAESAVKPSIKAVITLLKRALGEYTQESSSNVVNVKELSSGRLLLNRQTEQLFGKLCHGRRGHIMVTLDAEATWN
jgi:pyruvate kinase